MFSTTPSTGTLTLLNMAMPRRASISARSCGVETITAPANGTFCASVNCASPVPGGMSMTRQSSSPQATSRSICCTAPITIGPRQIIGVFFIEHEADRHGLHAEGLQRLDAPLPPNSGCA